MLRILLGVQLLIQAVLKTMNIQSVTLRKIQGGGAVLVALAVPEHIHS